MRETFQRSPFSVVLSTLLTTTSTFLIALGLVIGYLQLRKYEPPYIIVNPNAHFATQTGKNSITVGREFRVARDMDFHITREITRTHEGVLTRIALEDTHVRYNKGQYRVQRVHEIPTLTPGTYQLLNQICWPANFIRQDCLALPALDIQIFPD